MSPSIGKNVPKLKRCLAEARLALAPSCSMTLRPSLLVSRMAASVARLGGSIPRIRPLYAFHVQEVTSNRHQSGLILSSFFRCTHHALTRRSAAGAASLRLSFEGVSRRIRIIDPRTSCAELLLAERGGVVPGVSRGRNGA